MQFVVLRSSGEWLYRDLGELELRLLMQWLIQDSNDEILLRRYSSGLAGFAGIMIGFRGMDSCDTWRDNNNYLTHVYV